MRTNGEEKKDRMKPIIKWLSLMIFEFGLEILVGIYFITYTKTRLFEGFEIATVLNSNMTINKIHILGFAIIIIATLLSVMQVYVGDILLLTLPLTLTKVLDIIIVEFIYIQLMAQGVIEYDRNLRYIIGMILMGVTAIIANIERTILKKVFKENKKQKLN